MKTTVLTVMTEDRAKLDLAHRLLIAFGVRGAAIATREETPGWLHLEVRASQALRAQQLIDAFETGIRFEQRAKSRALGQPAEGPIQLIESPAFPGQPGRVIAV